MGDMEKKASLVVDHPPLSRRVKLITTFAIYLCNVAYGCAFNAYAPALVDLQNKYDVETNVFSVVYTVITVSLCCGAITSGFIYNFIHRQLGVVILVSLMAVSMYAAPLCPTLTTFFVSAGLLGFTAGAFDSTEVVWIMEIWQHESGPYIQAQHLSYAVGSLIPSLVLAPFLSKESDNDEEGVTTTTTLKSTDDNSTQKLIAPFLIVAAFVTLAAVTQLVLFIFVRYHPPPPEEGRLEALFEKEKETVQESNNNNGEKDGAGDKDASYQNGSIQDGELKIKPVVKRDFYRIKLIVMAAMFLGAYSAMEICTLQFWATFAQHGTLGLSKSEAANTLSGLTGAFTAGRAIGILAILKIPPQIILCVNLFLVISANVILLLFSDTSRAWLWTGAILMGLGFSTIYPSYCAFIERHLLFTSWVGAIMLITGSIIASVYPVIIGGSIDEKPVVVTYTNFFTLFWAVLSLALASWFVFKRKKQAKKLLGVD